MTTCRPTVVTFIAASQRWWRAECRCTWTGAGRGDKDAAWVDARSHGDVGA